MRTDQAVFGQVQGRGHGLRESTCKEAFVTGLADRMDLPDAVPLGVSAWSPFIRGFPTGDHYVLARTFADPTASRGGMVVSHALIVKLDEVVALDSLAQLFGHLPATTEACTGPLLPLELPNAVSACGPAPEAVGLANALMDATEFPVVRLGTAGFEQLVDSLWGHFWPRLRREFAFRLSFAPIDIRETPRPLLVCTPEQLQVRWSRHRLVQADDQTPVSTVAAILAGQRDPAVIHRLAATLGLQLRSFRELARVDALHTLASSAAGIEEAIGAVRLASSLSPDVLTGADLKNQLLDQVVDYLAHANWSHLLLMRNLRMTGFVRAPVMWRAVKSATQRLAGTLSRGANAEFQQVVRDAATEGQAEPAWRVAVQAGIADATAGPAAEKLFQVFWDWAGSSADALFAGISLLPTSHSVEQSMVAEAPKSLAIGVAGALLAPMLARHWLSLHGAILAATHAPLDAARLQLAASAKDVAGLRVAVRHANPLQLLELALALKHPMLTALCVEAAVHHPRILSGFRCVDITEQEIWAGVLAERPAAWSAPAAAAEVRDQVVLGLLAREPTHRPLVEVLSTTPLADLSHLSERADLWDLFPAVSQARYLRATAQGWLTAVSKAQAASAADPMLERTILAMPELEATLENGSRTLKARLAIVSALQGFPETRFSQWVDFLLQAPRGLSADDAEALGMLMASRRWERTAIQLADRHGRYRNDLMPALRYCTGMLGFFRCWGLGLRAPTSAEKWQGLEEVVCELYPSGPDTNELWSRAGGKSADLPARSSSSSWARWHQVLNTIRYGGRPGAKALLARMMDDFPGNEALPVYARDSDIVGRR